VGIYVSALFWTPKFYGQILSQPGQIDVVYTGALYGYFRDDAPTFADTDGLVGSFIARHAGPSVEHPDRNKPLLLGLGDNFGPEFGASIQEEDRPGCLMMKAKSEDYPQALYKDDLRVASSADCDNVAHFLVEAGYRAIVPGRNDFMYGAGWLRETAANLRASRDAANVDKRLMMLAANLRIKFQSSESGGNGRVKLQSLCPLLFAPNRALFALGQTPKPGQIEDTSNQSATCSSQTEGSPPELLDVLDRMTLVMSDSQIEASLNQTTDVLGSSSPRGSNVPNDVIQHRNQIIFNQLDQLRLMSWGLPRTGNLLKEIGRLQNRVSGTTATYFSPDEIKSLRDCIASLSDPSTDCPANAATAGNANHPGSATPAQTQASCTFLPLRPTSGDLGDLNSFANGLLEVLVEVCMASGKVDALTAVNTLIVDRESGLAGIRALLRAIAREQWNSGYTITPLNPSRGEAQKVIIGVVGESTLQDVSLSNRQFCFSVPAENKPGTITYHYCEKNVAGNRHARLQAQVYEFDPVKTIVAIIRAVKLTHPGIQSVIVLAQMPHTEAEELAAAVQVEIEEVGCVVSKAYESSGEGHDTRQRTRCGLLSSQNPLIPPVDFILSEAQDDHASGDLQMTVSGSVGPAPVLTPRHAYRSTSSGAGLLKDPASEVTYVRKTSSDENAPDVIDTRENQSTIFAERTISFILRNAEPQRGLLRANSKQASVLLAQKILAIPEDQSPDPPSPYDKIYLGKLRDGKALTVGVFLRDACDPTKNATRAIASSCALAIQRLLMQMLQRGDRLPGDFSIDEYINPAHQLTDISLLEDRDL
jgi:hypothetical protein